MDDMVSATSAGLNSLSGFSFQIKAFILMMTQLTDGKCVEFETLDDVVVRDIPSNDKAHDSCIKTRETEDGAIIAFQVKQTKVTDSIARKIVYNWLLALNKNPSICSFELIVDKGYSYVSTVFSNSAEKEYKIVMDSDLSGNALVTQVKEIYKDRPEGFIKDFEFIKDHHCSRPISNIEHDIAEKLCLPFHSSMSDADNPHFSMRIKELFIRVCARIMECAGNRIPYICSYAEYLQLCEEICKNISEEQYNPDYDSFKTVCMSSGIEEAVRESREYRQLGYCKLTDSDRIEHLRWEQYYQNIRQHYLTDAKKGQISKTEDVAYRNYADVVAILQEDDKDTPKRRLVNTKKQPISTLSDEYSRWGAYIFLTREESEQQISWKDEEGENGG
jgi:hypothetical protein